MTASFKDKITGITNFRGVERRVVWWIVGLEQGFILLVGGGLLAFAVRRERRREAETAR